MKTNELTLEKVLYLLAFVLALVLRVWQLDWLPLSDSEASQALQALAVANGESIVPTSQAAYLSLTGALFFLFGAGDGLARLVSAFAGAMIVWLPFLTRSYLGRVAGLVLAFGLALDPGLVAISRQAGGPMLALAAGLLFVGLLISHRPLLAGISGGIALLAGPATLHGLIISGVTGLLIFGLARAGRLSSWSGPEGDSYGGSFLVIKQRKTLLAGLFTVFLVGTLFFRFPAGLSALWQTIPDYFNGWIHSSGIPALRLLAALIIYQPLALLFALISFWQAVVTRSGFAQRVSVWLGGALLVVLIYPARQVGDLIWVLIPIWALAALTIQELFQPFSGQRWIATLQAILIFTLLTMLWLNLATFDQPLPVTQTILVRAGFVVGILALAALTTALIGLGWSWASARRGAGWGLILGLGVYMLANIWNAAQLRPIQTQDLWLPYPRTGQAGLLVNTVEDLSEWSNGQREGVDVVVALDSPALHWSLRDFVNLRVLPERQSLNFQELPSIIIASPQQDSPKLAASYRGQDFVWRTIPGWTGILPDNTLHWLLFREASQQSESVILWARSDLFPGGALVREPPAELPLELDPYEDGP